MRRAVLAAVALALAGALAPANADVSLKLPPPDIANLVPLAALPLDKPPVALPAIAPPATPGFPDPPAPRLVSDISHRPVAPMPPPRMLACNPVGTVFRVASELIECGRARYQKGELEPARSAFQSAAQGSSDRAQTREARYWLGETLLRLGRPAEAQGVLAQVAPDDPRGEFAPYATLELGFIALEQNDASHALGYFETLLKQRIPVTIIPYSRHGRALALYGLKRYAEARDEWSAALAGGATVPRPLATEIAFWMGDTLGRLGDYRGAVARLQAFTNSGTRLLMDRGLWSLGWWSRANGQPEEALKAYRTLLSSYPSAGELAIWTRAGMALALLDLNDFPKAREEAKQVETLDKSGTVAIPTLLALRRWAAEKSKVEEARALDTNLLARQLDPVTRGWVLLLSAELARQSGNLEEARDRLELIRSEPVPAAVKQQADLRRAQISFEARDYPEARSGAQAILAQPVPADVRAAAMLLAAESAYWARDYEQAASLYSRFLTEMSDRPEAPAAGLALGWAEFRRGRLDAARQRWVAFTRESTADRRTAETLLLAAELAAKAGDDVEARALLDRVVGEYPGTEAADVATVNRAILALRANRPQDALTEIGRLGARAASAPELARARVVRGVAMLASKRDAQAEADLKSALGQGDDTLCHLGLGVIAFNRGHWDAAAREFTEAHNAGGAGAAAAEYGLAAVLFNQGKADEFAKAAGPLIAGPPDLATTPHLLHGMEAIAIQNKRWPEARTQAVRLADQFPRHPVTPVALDELATAAGANGEWPLARDMYKTVATRYPTNAGRPGDRVTYAEALLRTGAAADARHELEAVAMSMSATDPARRRVLPLLAEAQESAGDRAAAAQTYARFAKEFPNGDGVPKAELGAGRILQADGRWSEARPLLEQAVKDGDPATAAEASYYIGEGLRTAGQHDDAIEAYMTAAYVAPDTVWGRRGLLGAGRSFAALRQNDSAAIVYRKLLASSAGDSELESAARSGLKSIGQD